MEAKAEELFQDAIQKLNQAREESCRPEEDVVTYLVCKNAQVSVDSFLRGYLLQHNIDPANYTTLESLYEKCKAINKNFEKVDLQPFDCKSVIPDASFCDDPTKVCDCLSVSGSLEELLKQEKVIE